MSKDPYMPNNNFSDLICLRAFELGLIFPQLPQTSLAKAVSTPDKFLDSPLECHCSKNFLTVFLQTNGRVFYVGCRPTSAFWQRGNQSYMTKKQLSGTNKTENFCLDFGNRKLAINLEQLF